MVCSFLPSFFGVLRRENDVELMEKNSPSVWCWKNSDRGFTTCHEPIMSHGLENLLIFLFPATHNTSYALESVWRGSVRCCQRQQHSFIMFFSVGNLSFPESRVVRRFCFRFNARQPGWSEEARLFKEMIIFYLLNIFSPPFFLVAGDFSWSTQRQELCCIVLWDCSLPTKWCVELCVCMV